MNPVQTSRGTVIKKQLAIVEQATFPLDDILNFQGEFIHELNEIHRYLGSQIDTAHLRDVFTPNVENIKQQFKDNMNAIYNQFKEQISAEVTQIIPNTGSLNDPVIVEHKTGEALGADYTLTLSYHKSPYQEKPVEYDENGNVIEV